MNLNNKLQCFKRAVAFFFLFFLHETSIGNGRQGITHNVLQLPEGGEYEAQILN